MGRTSRGFICFFKVRVRFLATPFLPVWHIGVLGGETVGEEVITGSREALFSGIPVAIFPVLVIGVLIGIRTKIAGLFNVGITFPVAV